MKKFVKFMSLLLVVPMLGVVSLFTGCGKDEVSLSQVMESYNNMVIKYQSDSNTNIMVGNKNSMFTFTNNIVKGENNSFNYFNEGSSFDLDFDINMTVQDVDNRATNDLKTMYNHLIYYKAKSNTFQEENMEAVSALYPRVLQYSNLYFKKYQRSFFEASPDKFDEEALGRLNNKIKNLDKALENFHNNMVDRTELIGFYGSDTKVMESKLATFNSVYIDLISANYDFVLE